MGSVNISLKKEAYEKLAAIKKPDESFSDEILRLTSKGTGKDMMDCFGAWKGLSKGDIKTIEKSIKSGRSEKSGALRKFSR